jgi:hypothetical protein
MSIVGLPSAKLGEVGIGITARDRWDDLAATPSELISQGYGDLETIVIDDSSLCLPLPKQ